MNVELQCDVQSVNGTIIAIVAALAEGKLVHQQRIDLSSAPARSRFANAVGKAFINVDESGGKARLHMARAKVEELLQRKLDELRATAKPAVEDLNVEQIVRPDLIITPELAALTMPTFQIAGGQPTGGWKLYVQCCDGRREVRDLPKDIELPGGQRVWIYPQPTPPSPDQVPGWSTESRARWMEGA